MWKVGSRPLCWECDPSRWSAALLSGMVEMPVGGRMPPLRSAYQADEAVQPLARKRASG